MLMAILTVATMTMVTMTMATMTIATCWVYECRIYMYIYILSIYRGYELLYLGHSIQTHCLHPTTVGSEGWAKTQSIASQGHWLCLNNIRQLFAMFQWYMVCICICIYIISIATISEPKPVWSDYSRCFSDNQELLDRYGQFWRLVLFNWHVINIHKLYCECFNMAYRQVPSGKQPHNYGKIHHFLIGKSTISMAIFQLSKDFPSSCLTLVQGQRWIVALAWDGGSLSSLFSREFVHLLGL